MKLYRYLLLLGLAVAGLFIVLYLTPIGQKALYPITNAISVLSNVAIVILMACVLFFLIPVTGTFVRRGIDRIDKVDDPDKDMEKWQHLLIAGVLSLIAAIVQMSLAAAIILNSPLRPLMESMGQVPTVIETGNIWWGVWGLFWFLFMYLRWWKVLTM